MKHCAANRQAKSSIPDGTIEIFNCLNPSGRTVALGSTQPATEMSTRNVLRGLRRPVRRADNPSTFICRLFQKSREPQNPGALGAYLVL